MKTRTKIRFGAVCVIMALSNGPVWAEGGLTVELNKLAPSETSCEAFFLFRNPTSAHLEGFELSLAVLDQSGVIDSLLTIDAAPIPAERTSLKLFEIPVASCDAISEIILHDIPVCDVANQGAQNCYDLVTLTSRAPVPLVK